MDHVHAEMIIINFNEANYYLFHVEMRKHINWAVCTRTPAGHGILSRKRRRTGSWSIVPVVHRG